MSPDLRALTDTIEKALDEIDRHFETTRAGWDGLAFALNLMTHDHGSDLAEEYRALTRDLGENFRLANQLNIRLNHTVNKLRLVGWEAAAINHGLEKIAPPDS